MARSPNVEPYHPETGTTPEPEGFDVICKIGRVVFGGGDDAPSVAAFKLIAEHGAPGEFSFPTGPGPHNGTVRVTVEYIDPPKDDRGGDPNATYDRPNRGRSVPVDGGA